MPALGTWPDRRISPLTDLDRHRSPLSDEHLSEITVGTLTPLDGPVLLVEYDPGWPESFAREAERIQGALGARALRVEHVGSTSVPGLVAKPVIDVVLTVANSADEGSYLPSLEEAGYALRIREPAWHEHRLLKRADPDVNLHVFSWGSSEIERMLTFRDHLRSRPDDRERYAEAKRDLARRVWKYRQNYADAKTGVIEEILSRTAAASPSR